MNKVAVAALAAVLFGPLSVSAQEKPESGPTIPGNRQTQLDVIKKALADAWKAFEKKYEAAKTDEERQKLVESEAYPRGDEYAKKLMPIVEADPKDSVAADALCWIIRQSQEPATKAKARDLLLTHHIKSESMAELCSDMAFQPSKSNLEAVDWILKETPHKSVKGKAHWAKAQILTGAVSTAKTLAEEGMKPEERKSYEEYLGADTIAWVKTLDAKAATAESEKIYELIAENYADVPLWGDRSLADAAKGELFEIRNLAIGKTAPDIVGKDADGVEFKLSDYRGKVVVLDFWGYW